MTTKPLLIILLILPLTLCAQIKLEKADTDKGSPFSIPFGENNAVSVPFSYINDVMVIDVVLNKSLPLKFIFDTGSETSIITKEEIAQALRIPRGRFVEIYGADRLVKLQAQILPYVTLNLGNIEFEYFPILLLLDDYFNTSSTLGIETHGIIGADILRRFIIQIDPAEQLITFHKKIPPYYKMKNYTRIDCDYKKGRFFSDLTIKKSGKVSTDRFLLDTGSSKSIIYQLDTLKEQIASDLIPTTISQGLGGEIKGYIGLADSLDFKEGISTNIPIQYQVVNSEDSLFSMRKGIIGNPLLKQYDLVFDYGKGDLYARKNKFFGQEITRDKSGMNIIASGPVLQDFVVTFVIADSPADIAGIQKDDLIVSIQHLNKRFIGLNDINNKLTKRSGKRIKLKIKRGDEYLRVKFRLEDYLMKKFKA